MHTLRTTYIAVLIVTGSLLATGCHVAHKGQNLEGVRLYKMGNYHSALQQFQQVIAADPKNVDAHYNMAATFHQMGVQSGDANTLKQAEQLYQQCLLMEPDHVDCHRGLAVLLVETGRPKEAFAELERWAFRSPKSADARIELARLYHEWKDYSTARLHLDTALQIDPQNARAWRASGLLHEEANEYQEALASYTRSYQHNSLQTGLQQRIAALQNTLTTSGQIQPGVTQPGTRLVTPGLPSYR